MALNQTSHHDSSCDGFHYNPNVAPSLYFSMFPIALLLNSVAAWVSLHLACTTTFVVYLKNLVAADFILTLIIPIIAASHLPNCSRLLYVTTCRYVSPVFYSTQYICIAQLGFIGLDRFFKIMMPQNKLAQNVTLSKVIAGSAWVIMYGGAVLPTIILSNKSATNLTETTTCLMLKEQIGIELHEKIVICLNAFFWLVSVVIAVCYICITHRVIQSFKSSGSNNSHGKHKIKLRVFVVVVVFFVSFAPYHIYRVPYTFQQVNQGSSKTSCSYLKAKFAKELTLWLASMNTCMDPLIYVFLCREFKDKLVSMMKNVSTFCKVASAGKEEVVSV